MRNLLSVFFMLLCLQAYANGPLVISYATSQLNGVEGAVVGVVMTPDGERIVTAPMGPFDHCNIVIDAFDEGSYEAYFEVLTLGAFRLCPIVGGIVATFTDSPETSIPFTPKASRIQIFPPGKPIQVGSTSRPRATFTVIEN